MISTTLLDVTADQVLTTRAHRPSLPAIYRRGIVSTFWGAPSSSLMLAACARAVQPQIAHGADTALSRHRGDVDAGHASYTEVGHPSDDSRSASAVPASAGGPTDGAVTDYLTQLSEGIAVSSTREDEVPPALSGYSRAQVFKVLGLDASPQPRIRAARVADSPSFFVLTFRQIASTTELSTLDPRVFLMHEKSGDLVRTASGQFAFSTQQCVDRNPASDNATRDLEIDERTYAVAAGTITFAVRLTCSTSEISRDGEETHVFVFEPEQGNLAQVLSFVANRAELDRAGGYMTTETTTFSTRPAKKNEHVGVNLRTRIERATAPLDDSPARVVENRTRTQRLEWSGTAYIRGKLPRP